MLQPDYLLDVGKLQKRLDRGRDNPLRWRQCTFHIPRQATARQADSATKNAINTWLNSEYKSGWELKNRVKVHGPFEARDLETGVVLLDMWEFKALAPFALKSSLFRPQRIELDPKIVRQAPDQTMTLHEAMDAYGMESGA